MRDRMSKALRLTRADYAEIRIEERQSTNIVFRGEELETASAVIDKGGIARCLSRENGWGISTFNDLDDLPARIEEAYACASVARAAEPIDLAVVPAVEEIIPAHMLRDFRGISMGEKKTLAEAYNLIALHASPKIVDTQTSYSDSLTRVTFASSDGTYIQEDRPSVAVGCVVTARDGDNVQMAHEGRAGPFGYEFAQNREELARTASQRALELLSARSVVGGRYPVVVDPRLGGVFIHEAFGHLSESDFIYENPKAREMMILGRRFGRDILNVYDDGSAPGLRGTHRYDDEGTPCRRNDLIKAGILVGRLHSRETAARMGERPTGNARAINYRHPPIVRMTNTAVAAGTTSFQGLIGDIKLGIYACDAYGGNTAMESFSFSSGYAHMIRDGRIAEMVKDVILAGNLFTTLQSIEAIGDDFQWILFMGGCGKSGQFPLPVSMGAPHIRIENVVIGGTAAAE